MIQALARVDQTPSIINYPFFNRKTPMKASIVYPKVPVTAPEFKYTNSAQTNIMERFKALGWVPPSEVNKEKTK